MESSVLEEKVFHKVMKNVPFGLVVSSGQKTQGVLCEYDGVPYARLHAGGIY